MAAWRTGGPGDGWAQVLQGSPEGHWSRVSASHRAMGEQPGRGLPPAFPTTRAPCCGSGASTPSDGCCGPQGDAPPFQRRAEPHQPRSRLAGPNCRSRRVAGAPRRLTLSAPAATGTSSHPSDSTAKLAAPPCPSLHPGLLQAPAREGTQPPRGVSPCFTDRLPRSASAHDGNRSGADPRPPRRRAGPRRSCHARRTRDDRCPAGRRGPGRGRIRPAARRGWMRRWPWGLRPVDEGLDRT
ncbi:hypothetical protein J2Z33_003356 [Rubellimicrobium aerolatum]|nr:hypothetical protein [Rubellimicrobium aerolatum]